jgi:hypothetical protein
MSDYVTHDSGSMSEYEDGMRRDDTTGKPMFSLMFPKGVPYEEQMITRLAALYARGAEKYGARNHEKSSTEESLAHHEDAFLRHVFKFLTGVEDGEDHGAAVLWNAIAIDLTRRNIKAKQEQHAASQEFPLSDSDTVEEAYKKMVDAYAAQSGIATGLLAPSLHDWWFNPSTGHWERVRHKAFCASKNNYKSATCDCKE